MASTKSSLKLYSFSRGLFPPRVLLYIKEKGMSSSDIEIVDVPFEKGIRFDLAITDNPAEAPLLTKCVKSVPVLRITKPDGTKAFIYESAPILTYLEEYCRQFRPDLPALDGGNDLISRATVAEAVGKINEITTLFQMWGHHSSALFVHKIGTQDPNVARVCLDQIRSQLQLLEDRIDGKGPFLCGDQVSIADCTAYATFQLAINFYDMTSFLDDFKILKEWYAMFGNRESVKTVIPGMEEFPDWIVEAARNLSVK